MPVGDAAARAEAAGGGRAAHDEHVRRHLQHLAVRRHLAAVLLQQLRQRRRLASTSECSTVVVGLPPFFVGFFVDRLRSWKR